MTFMLDVHWPRDCAGNGWILEAKEEVNLTGLDLHLHVFLSMEFICTKYIKEEFSHTVVPQSFTTRLRSVVYPPACTHLLMPTQPHALAVQLSRTHIFQYFIVALTNYVHPPEIVEFSIGKKGECNLCRMVGSIILWSKNILNILNKSSSG